jgi:hypothetical protein
MLVKTPRSFLECDVEFRVILSLAMFFLGDEVVVFSLRTGWLVWIHLVWPILGLCALLLAYYLAAQILSIVYLYLIGKLNQS